MDTVCFEPTESAASAVVHSRSMSTSIHLTLWPPHFPPSAPFSSTPPLALFPMAPGASGIRVRRRKQNAPDAHAARLHEIRKRSRGFWRRVNYPTLVSAVILPLAAFCYLVHERESVWPANPRTATFSFAYYVFCTLAFTMGYHKHYAHWCFATYGWLEAYFVVFGAAVGIGPARLWAVMHRTHHRCTDDAGYDPYSIKRGFLWAHWGWLLQRPRLSAADLVDHRVNVPVETVPAAPTLGSPLDPTSALDPAPNAADDPAGPGASSPAETLPAVLDSAAENLPTPLDSPWLLWQEVWVWPLFVLTTLVLPAAITVFVCHDSWIHGILYPGILRMFACQQLVLSSESVGHSRRLVVSIPAQPFSDANSLVDSLNPLVALLTFGQALHNFHHEFPHDYRGSPSVWAYDPTKWAIWVLQRLGAVHNVYSSPALLVQQLEVQQQQKVLNRVRTQLDWGTPILRLPLITPREFRRICSEDDRLYIVILNIIHDITPFMEQHPGGPALLLALHGMEATKAFYGGVYRHLAAAVNLLATMRIGVLDGNDEDVWHRAVNEEGDVDTQRAGLYKTAEAA